jgi:hypothetical protein
MLDGAVAPCNMISGSSRAFLLCPGGGCVFSERGLFQQQYRFDDGWAWVKLNLASVDGVGSGAANDRGWQPGPDPVKVAKSMRFGVETMIPTVCGGGAFGYAGKGGTAFGVKMFSGAIYEWDSNNEKTIGTLKEAGAGGVGGGFIHSSSGLLGLGYVELGEIPGLVDAGAVGGNGWAGGYAEGELFGGEVGGGAYADITSVAACDQW